VRLNACVAFQGNRNEHFHNTRNTPDKYSGAERQGLSRGQRDIGVFAMRNVYFHSPHNAPSLLGIALFAAISWASTAQAATRVVTNCNDAGPGSVRAAIASAASGDTIDLTGVGCSRILLTSGELTVPQDNLTVVGKGRFELTIDGNRSTRVFNHSGSGALHLHRLSVANGRVAVEDNGSALGGCIIANRVVLTRSRVHHCESFNPGGTDVNGAGGAILAGSVLLSQSSVFSSAALGNAEGGGIYARSVVLYRSQVYGNFASFGGGIFAYGSPDGDGVRATYSLIHGNSAASAGGGIFVTDGELRLNKSTVSNNRIDQLREEPYGFGPMAGGMYTEQRVRTVIVDSTISGNTAPDAGAAQLGTTFVYNSTIAYNRNGVYPGWPGFDNCGELAVFAVNTIRTYSSIYARGSCPTGVAYDLLGTVTGSDNLVERSQSAVPPDTIQGLNPRLLPLADYGGPVRTHALGSDSPAINRGSNVLGLEFDQRGPGFPRIRGAFADIGAVEY
jgi:hypothetical protein